MSVDLDQTTGSHQLRSLIYINSIYKTCSKINA